jgi:hypothetical protein
VEQLHDLVYLRVGLRAVLPARYPLRQAAIKNVV